MFKKLASLALVGLMIQTLICVESASASSKAEKEAQRVENMKARVLKLAVSKETNIRVTLRDKTKVVGVISDVSEDSFVLTDPKPQPPRLLLIVMLHRSNANGRRTGRLAP